MSVKWHPHFRSRPLSNAQRAYIEWVKGEPADYLNSAETATEYQGFLAGYAASEARHETLLAALREAERFLDYFANGRTAFEGAGTPRGALEQVRTAIAASNPGPSA